jgi:hypothetical protein
MSDCETTIEFLSYAAAMRAGQWLKARIDVPLALRAPVPKTAARLRMYVIERERNRINVDLFASQADYVHRWPLDEKPGLKFELLAEMMVEHAPQPGEWVVIADDDVRIIRGDLRRLVSISNALGFDLAQPGVDRRSFHTWGITVSRPLTRARLTSFVEIGPLFVIAPDAVERATAEFASFRMGFGLEELWHALGLRLGVVDEVRVWHLQAIGQGYDWRVEWDHSRAELATRGIAERQEQAVLRWWWVWRPLHR